MSESTRKTGAKAMTPFFTKRVRLSNGALALIRLVPLHGRHRRGIYRRPTDWIATSGTEIAWGRTRRDALSRFVKLYGGTKVVSFR